MISLGRLPRLKKYQTALIGAIFLIYAGIGFYLANEVRLYLTAPEATLPPTPPVLYPQHNFLFIHVDDLSREKPKLISIWVLFSLSSDPPSLTFKPIYPKLAPFKSSNPLADSFALTGQRSLAPDFSAELGKFDFEYEGYILLDHQAILALSAWVTGGAHQVTGETPANIEQAWNVVAQEQSILEQICEKLVIPAEQRGPPVRWRNLIPNHLQTNLRFETVITSWDTITASVSAPNCRVVGIPQQ